MLIDMYSLVENVIGCALFIWGLAILINKNILKTFINNFVQDMEKNQVVLYLTACMFLILGLITVWVHNDWYWGSTSIIVTILGWILVIKTSLLLMFPKHLLKLAKKLSPIALHPWFRIGYGSVITILGLAVLSRYYMEKILMIFS